MAREHTQSGVLPSDPTSHTRQFMQGLLWDGVHSGPELLFSAAEVSAGMVMRCQRMLSPAVCGMSGRDSRLLSQSGIKE